MDAELMNQLGFGGLIIAPAAIVAIIMLVVAAKGLRRGGAGAAFGAFLIAIAGVAFIGGGATFVVRKDALERIIPDCEARQAAARAGAYLFDCESEGLIVAFPVIATMFALGFVVIGAVLMRVTRRR